VSGDILSRIADLAEQYGSGRIRLTPHQKLVILDVADSDTAALAGDLEDLGLRTAPSAFRASAMACTGIEYCKLAISETKARAADLIAELESRLPDFDTPLAIHVNGCPNSCARFQVADIGLKGVLVPHEGEQVEGFQVHLGGSLGERSGFGKSLRGHRLAGEDLADYIERVLRNYLAERSDGETFAEWTTRALEEVLR
jgi:sulfite reductase (ferredoxin)